MHQRLNGYSTRFPSPWRRTKESERKTNRVRIPQDIEQEVLAIALLIDAAKHPNVNPSKQVECAVDVVSVLESALAIAKQQQGGAA
ncbi:MAG: hypothetical protein KatS3mg087_0526 [Patescibacteria group bacterium]|jgi:hypothetical protein|nr:MAG: hypothetical protein KatS3mg087_0526 [Patescibacteria group bacterium]